MTLTNGTAATKSKQGTCPYRTCGRSCEKNLYRSENNLYVETEFELRNPVLDGCSLIVKPFWSFLFFLYFPKDWFIWERECECAHTRTQAGEGQTERGRERLSSRLPAEQGVRNGARSYNPEAMTWAGIKSRLLNRLSRLGALNICKLLIGNNKYPYDLSHLHCIGQIKSQVKIFFFLSCKHYELMPVLWKGLRLSIPQAGASLPVWETFQK